jgi:hypothetical protein
MVSPEELLSECGIVLKYGCGKFKNQSVRYLEDSAIFQIGGCDNNFDRWGNSVALEFDLWTPKGQRAFLRWVKS